MIEWLILGLGVAAKVTEHDSAERRQRERENNQRLHDLYRQHIDGVAPKKEASRSDDDDDGLYGSFM